MARIDYLSDEDGDIQIANGDLVKGESDFYHIKMICELAPGHLRQFPEVGFNIIRYKNAQSSVKARFESELRDQIEADGYTVKKIDLSKREWWKDFTIDAQ